MIREHARTFDAANFREQLQAITSSALADGTYHLESSLSITGKGTASIATSAHTTGQNGHSPREPSHAANGVTEAEEPYSANEARGNADAEVVATVHEKE
jgi:hypothetical protein